MLRLLIENTLDREEKIMAEWLKTSLIDIVELIGGGTPKTSKAEYWGGNINWLSVKDFNNENRYVYSTEKTITEEGLNNSSTKLLRKDDIIISARGTVGELAMIPFPMAFNQSCYGIRAKDGINSTFLYYLIKHSVRKLKAMTHGSIFDTITRDTFANIEVAIPDIETQQRVAKMLADIDDKVENNQRINENLCDQMKAIYLHAKKSSIWNECKLGEILTFYDHMRKPLSSRQREGMVRLYPYYGATSVVDYVDAYIFDGVYILISEDGANVVDALGHPLIQYTYGKFWVNNHAHIVQGNMFYSEALLFALLKTLNMSSIVTGAAQPKINQANLKDFCIVAPSNQEAMHLSNVLNPFLEQIIKNDLQNTILSNLRDTLLPRLMSGELDISNLDI